MKANESKKSVVRITESHQQETAGIVQEGTQNKTDKLKKPLIFGLMGIVFLGCMYLIFRLSSDQNKIENIGLNDTVPQATDPEMQEDKEKAYEQEILEQKDQEKQNALTTLSDYWNEERSANDSLAGLPKEDQNNGFGSGKTGKQGNNSLNSYRNTQNELGSFYNNSNAETIELRKQLNELKEQLEEKEIPKSSTIDDQLTLMEKSYQMASKYLPKNTNNGEVKVNSSNTSQVSSANQKEHFLAFSPSRKNIVSTLYREASDTTFLEDWSQIKNSGFYTAGSAEKIVQPKNSIKACVHDTQLVIGETGVRLRLLEPAKTPNHIIPKGTIVIANTKFQGGRLQLEINSIELDGSIIPVDMAIYDLDGQLGLNVPYSPERNALTDIVANMGNATGSNFSMSSSTGQQLTSDLSKSAVQGISGYFAKKVRTPKVTLKAGYQVFLVAKQ